jgi:hypothetical protein
METYWQSRLAREDSAASTWWMRRSQPSCQRVRESRWDPTPPPTTTLLLLLLLLPPPLLPPRVEEEEVVAKPTPAAASSSSHSWKGKVNSWLQLLAASAASMACRDEKRGRGAEDREREGGKQHKKRGWLLRARARTHRIAFRRLISDEADQLKLRVIEHLGGLPAVRHRASGCL